MYLFITVRDGGSHHFGAGRRVSRRSPQTQEHPDICRLPPSVLCRTGFSDQCRLISTYNIIMSKNAIKCLRMKRNEHSLNDKIIPICDKF